MFKFLFIIIVVFFVSSFFISSETKIEGPVIPLVPENISENSNTATTTEASPTPVGNISTSTKPKPEKPPPPPPLKPTVPIPKETTKPTGATYSEDFSSNYKVKEVGHINETKNSNWWLGSGAYFYSQDGLGSTLTGAISSWDYFRLAYLKSNPTDTDKGYYPQNIFRLVNITKKWKNIKSQIYFNIESDNLSESQNRNQSNGILLMTRYKDANNLYYAGLRVDGTFIIKKKKEGDYYTLAQKKIEGILEKYDRKNNPNLLPHKKWLGIKVEVLDLIDGETRITLFADMEKTGNFIKVLEVVDDGVKFGGETLSEPGYVGIRTDFMDVYFDNFKIEEI